MSSPETAVVLLHGLGRTRWALARMERALRRAGYATLNRSYPSTRHPIDRLAREVVGARLAEAERAGARRVHFVTHSLGGILVRYYAAHVGLPAGTRAVTVAPPHGGSEVADWLQGVQPFRWGYGPTLGELGTGPTSVPLRLGPLHPHLELGVIAGDSSAFPFLDGLTGEATDGLVTLGRARVEGMADFCVVPHGHTFIGSRPATIRQALHFLAHGRFSPSARADVAGVEPRPAAFAGR
jgi:pimeloyl-ACP methyl ester carboxylesterase